jgi:ABC-type Fe3+/spermidine/putrescine transport system ATPase subunit
MSSVSLQAVTKSYSGIVAVDRMDLEIGEGEFIVLLGPSGCGKTTTLRMIAGFVEPSGGTICIGGRDVTALPPRRRNIGMVFQNYALFPNMTVAGNIGFGLRQRGVAGAEIDRRVDDLLQLVQLPGRGDDPIDTLSGGQQQRVALARALAYSPQVLLMDEPLGALDVKLRETLQLELLRLQRNLRITTILVTHDQHEAMVLADRIVVMAEGRIQQVAPPATLYCAPANAFVADFVGKSNLLRGRVVKAACGTERLLDLGAGIRVEIPAAVDAPPAREIELRVRPENVGLRAPSGRDDAPHGVIETIRFLGSVSHCFVRMRSGQVVMAEQPGRIEGLSPGDMVELTWGPSHAMVFAAPSGGT